MRRFRRLVLMMMLLAVTLAALACNSTENNVDGDAADGDGSLAYCQPKCPDLCQMIHNCAPPSVATELKLLCNNRCLTPPAGSQESIKPYLGCGELAVCEEFVACMADGGDATLECTFDGFTGIVDFPDLTDGDSDGDISDGDVQDGDTSDGDIVPDGDLTDGDVIPDGDGVDGDVDGDSPDGDGDRDGDPDDDAADGDQEMDVVDGDADPDSDGDLIDGDLTDNDTDLEIQCTYNGECDDGVDCTVDRCLIGKCSNTPSRDNCDAGYVCDPVRDCYPAEGRLCETCSAPDYACPVEDDVCVLIGSENYCVVVCDTTESTACPPGFVCEELFGNEGQSEGYACMPQTDVCCVDWDRDQAGIGAACEKWDCAEGVFDTHEGAPELCDGRDNDCDDITDEETVNCPGESCTGSALTGFLYTPPSECTQAGRCSQPTPVSCGLYACAFGSDHGDTCAESCEGETYCINEAYCDLDSSTCQGALPNGRACSANQECISSHCQNGFCCASGDCCYQASNCPIEAYNVDPYCVNEETCQGRRIDAICDGNTCKLGPLVDDDSGCAGEVADDCGAYPAVYCSGDEEQAAPSCSTTCGTDEECAANAHCTGGLCLLNFGNGHACTRDGECVSEHCQNGYCCTSGDCCAEAVNCPESYTEEPACTNIAGCQGSRRDALCTNNTCQTSNLIGDDSGCDGQEADDCDLWPSVYCTAEVNQTPPACSHSCAADEDCDESAHCDNAICVADLTDGSACDEASDCTSNYCNSGICCAYGDCCLTATNCDSATYGVDPTCLNQVTCQGTRTDPICVEHVCQRSEPIEDDSGCVGMLARNCGLLKDLVCTADLTQVAPVCPEGCLGDAECDANAHCDDGSCLVDQPDGASCDEASDCTSGHCQNGYCCLSGDCCASASSCPAAYSADAICDDTTNCQGSRRDAQCNDHVCAMSDPIGDDTACAGEQASNCGYFPSVFCSGDFYQTPPQCPTVCQNDDQCDENAHCDNRTCVADLGNGLACDEPSDCESGHCQNGFCCENGDCCFEAINCPDLYRNPPVCLTPASCQGERVDARCIDNACGTFTVQDDSGCGSQVEADACGPYPSVYCNGAVSQGTPSCASGCTSDGNCDDVAHCDLGQCVLDAGIGAVCDEQSDCQAGLTCVDGFCCNSPCEGFCQACDLPGHEGSCTAVPNGQDPDNECGAVNCTGYHWGWEGDTCYKVTNATADAVSCDGFGACQSVTHVCSQQGRGDIAAECHNLCQEPDPGTCSGFIGPECDNIDAGEETCGAGACITTVDRCTDGRPNNCIPGDSSPETCNNIDDDCNGIIDDNISNGGDAYEPNNNSADAANLGSIKDTDDEDTFPANIYGAGDIDWYYFKADEATHACVPFTNQSYSIKLTLVPPTGDDCRDYDVALYNSDGNFVTSATLSGCVTDVIEYSWGGTCGSDDSRNFYAKVYGFSGDWDCVEYQLRIDMKKN